MAKFYGKVGYIKSIEDVPGVWIDKVTEKNYYGDITRNFSQFQNSGNVNDNITISNSISIVADPYANENFQYIRYIAWNNVKWKVENVEVQYPRLLLTLGGLYNDYKE